MPEATLLCWNVAGRVKRLREHAELIASAELDVSVDGLELVNVHSPISSRPDLVKVRTHEALFAH